MPLSRSRGASVAKEHWLEPCPHAGYDRSALRQRRNGVLIDGDCKAYCRLVTRVWFIDTNTHTHVY